MKVAERDTNRTAEVHICVEGKLQPLKEYGQYVDPTDGAICCYVAVEEEDKIKFDGRFTGTVSYKHSYWFLTLGSQMMCRLTLSPMTRLSTEYVAKRIHTSANR